MAEKRGYPIGIQYFPEMIEKNGVYVDKTAYVYKMAHSTGKYFFLSRPRRFGKSLLVSTLEAFFKGRKELFKGLAIDKLEKDWIEYPVIRLDLSCSKYYDLKQLISTVSYLLDDYEKLYGLTCSDELNFSKRLSNIVKAAYAQTGQRVVILIDEYDAPMLDTIHKPDLQDQIRERVRDLFSPLKSTSEYLRFVFLTGISKFSQLSVFSELNNLKIITFDPEYEGVCGITEEELLTQMKPDIEWLAQELGYSYEHTVGELKRMYDGYHFSDKMTGVYNPWSLINAFDIGRIRNFWFSTGTPSSLINLLKIRHLQMPALEGLQARMSQFDAPTERISDPVPVLFQSGYLTLKAYDPKNDVWTLGFPNEEVHQGFAESLYLYYSDHNWTTFNLVLNAFFDFRSKKSTVEDFIEAVRRWYSMIPYSVTDQNQNEQLYQSLLYALLVGIGADVHAEEQTADGRIDISLKLDDAIYIIEFKYDKTAEAAVSQIHRKDYAVLFSADPRPVYAIGLNINSEKRSIESYKIEECGK